MFKFFQKKDDLIVSYRKTIRSIILECINQGKRPIGEMKYFYWGEELHKVVITDVSPNLEPWTFKVRVRVFSEPNSLISTTSNYEVVIPFDDKENIDRYYIYRIS